MEENKVTNEEIVKDIERSTGMPSYWKKVVLDLIRRLKNENDRLNDMKFTQEHCDLYKENEWLKAEIKRELAEHEEFTKKAKAEIERLKEKSISHYRDSWKNKFFKAQEEVERLTEELKYYRGELL